jgi:hypothetical protein
MNTLYKTAIRTGAILFAALFFMVSCKKDSEGRSNPAANKIDPGQGAGGEVITLTGSDLASIQAITFDKGNVPAQFNPNFNTAGAVIFRVPDTANGGAQNIVFTNVDGKSVSVPFNVIALPTITDVSNYDFDTGTEITLTGNNLDDVSSVTINGTTDAATIISKTKKQLTVKMPNTAATIAKLTITNASGTITTNQEFISIKNNFVVFAEDWGPGAYGIGGIQSWSWGSNLSTVSNLAKTGTKSLRVDYTDGALSTFLGCDWGTPNQPFTTFYPNAKYLTFWAMSVDADVNITIVPDNPWAGDAFGAATATGSKTVTVVKNVWTYFKIPANTYTGGYSRLDFKIDGSTNKTVYYDDILFSK